MSPVKVILLACGSFNPPTNMHLRMFEIARDHLHRLGNHVVIGGLISPVHDGYGKKELEAATHRIAMIRLALQSSDWIKLSDWECKQESWSRTKQVLQYHQNHVNALLNTSINNHFDKINEDNLNWVPDNVRNCGDNVQIKLLCGADLLESFGTPGLWSDDDIEAIVGQHGLVVITRSNTNPNEFIYNSDVLTKYMSNITIVTEWIQNEVSSTKIRRALRRGESIKYLIPEKVVDYIHKHNLYGSKTTKYLTPELNSNFLTPSPSDVQMESPSPNNCMIICNNTLFSRNYDKRLSIDTVDNVSKTNVLNTIRHPGQAVKIITESSGDHKVIKDPKEVRKEDKKPLKNSKSCANIDELHKTNIKTSKSNANLKECKSCDENLIKFIFTKHGIQVISDVETIV
ncbi:nicotinamide/nicotinic acid mononucleotide adenylyltransferase 3 isoform X1 [Tribolium castaneum]|uniref:nicotinamide/nicotinic acid mononucleotide adenylyltransferase 3 isoform X1 n=1 Tax=Tribolium castaneum TaxID=7070 RepID=UPI0000D56F3A|nr:PREDICTED: nicotinamide/nicotinic acid mononucleotide adenylyltransferase 3 isoform X1 [Tribolium castaneum]|eukprot:XP_015838667.1 PREDICTED: nicotinamide/nicotinic acid mononucleotide adenylyltransferase 3 isoform X1 [Tribolium castaneum]